MTWTNNQTFKMVVLKFRLLIVLYIIDGRYAYKGYLSDDANEFASSINSSQIHFNEPPGKLIFFFFEIYVR